MYHFKKGGAAPAAKAAPTQQSQNVTAGIKSQKAALAAERAPRQAAAAKAAADKAAADKQAKLDNAAAAKQAKADKAAAAAKAKTDAAAAAAKAKTDAAAAKKQANIEAQARKIGIDPVEYAEALSGREKAQAQAKLDAQKLKDKKAIAKSMKMSVEEFDALLNKKATEQKAAAEEKDLTTERELATEELAEAEAADAEGGKDSFQAQIDALTAQLAEARSQPAATTPASPAASTDTGDTGPEFFSPGLYQPTYSRFAPYTTTIDAGGDDYGTMSGAAMSPAQMAQMRGLNQDFFNEFMSNQYGQNLYGQGMPQQGMPQQGMPQQGMPQQGIAQAPQLTPQQLAMLQSQQTQLAADEAPAAPQMQQSPVMARSGGIMQGYK